MFKQIGLWVSCLLLIAACGGGGGGDDDNGGDGGGGGGGGIPGIAIPTDLQQGDFWEFYWFDSIATFAQGSGTSTDTDYGIFTVTLGAPGTVNGLQTFPLTITGDAGPYAPRWTHVAIDSDGSILGSTNGLNFETIYNADSGQWNGGGFFHDFDSNPVAASNGNFTGEYNTASAVRVGYDDAEGGCETILGITICDQTSTTFSFYEYYKSGIGPIGFRQDTTYTSSGGGFFTSHVLQKTVELIETSESATDMTLFQRPDWEEVAPMSTARRSPAAIAYGDEIWVMGGYDQSTGSTVFYSSVEIYDTTTNSWSAGPAMPGPISGEAQVMGGLIYVQSRNDWDTDIYRYTPGLGWTTITVNGGASIVYGDTDSYFEPVTYGNTILGIDGATAGPGTAILRGYSAGTNQEVVGLVALNVYEFLRPSVTIVGDSLYAIGGFGGSSSSGRGALDWVYQYDIVNDIWDTSSAADMPTPRDSLVTVELDTEIVALGGNAVTCSAPGPFESCNFGVTYRTAEAYDPTANSWRTLSSMLNPRQDFAAVELDGKLYAIGGYDGEDELASVERYTPP